MTRTSRPPLKPSGWERSAFEEADRDQHLRGKPGLAKQAKKWYNRRARKAGKEIR